MRKLTLQIKAPVQVTMLAASIGLLASCAATSTIIEHRNLESQTQLSKTVFLDPVGPAQKTIFIATRNTSDSAFDIQEPLSEALRAHGYRVLKNPTDAHYLLQVNILKSGKMAASASESALLGGYGSVLGGAATGAAIGTAMNGTTSSTLIGGVSGGLVSLAADALVKNVNYSVITDVQISERAGKGTQVSEQFNAHLSNGTASNTQQTLNRQSQYVRYRTRVVSNVNQVNLSFAKARPVLERGLVNTLAGIF